LSTIRSEKRKKENAPEYSLDTKDDEKDDKKERADALWDEEF
jgi:hypothetical protein